MRRLRLKKAGLTNPTSTAMWNSRFTHLMYVVIRGERKQEKKDHVLFAEMSWDSITLINLDSPVDNKSKESWLNRGAMCSKNLRRHPGSRVHDGSKGTHEW